MLSEEAEKAYEAVKEKIIHGEYGPGFPLAEIPLSVKYGTKRTRIRQILQRLERELAISRREMVSIDWLRKVDILQGLSEEELQSIAQFFEEENVNAGGTLCEEGASAERLYVLEQGKVSISSKRGGQYDIDTPGKIVGWSFLVPPFLYTASAVAKTPSKILVIKNPDFYYVIHKEPKVGMKVINNLAQVIASRLKGHEVSL